MSGVARGSGPAAGTATAGLFGEEDAARLVRVAVPVPLRRTFTYGVPPSLEATVVPGVRVAVPFGRRKLAGVVLDAVAEPPEGVTRLKNVAAVLDAEPIFPPELLRFVEEAAEYYMHPVGEVMRAAAPALPKEALKKLKGHFLGEGETLPGRHVAERRVLVGRRTEKPTEGVRLGKVQRTALEVLEARAQVTVDELRPHVRSPRSILRALADKGLVELEERQAPVDPFFGVPVERDEPPALRPAQQRAVDTIVATVCAGEDAGYLLHGVTGSGKTEVYLRVIAEVLERGRGALLLVPEIALTPQLVARFRARFGDLIAVLHSGLGERERHQAWRRLRQGAIRVAIGARSALFAPVPDLGLIVVDEEHDPSFKQEEGFRYHGRDMALLRAKRAGVACVLGSATPSIESYHLTERGKLRLLELPDRATAHRLPEVEIVDLRRHRTGPSMHPLISAPLHRGIERCMEAGEQTILFLNRRGFAPSLRCTACGAVAECPACSVALTEHRRAELLRCHYCDFRAPVAERCPTCGAEALDRVGLGTEQLESTLAELFAPARVARLDRDTATGKNLEGVLDRLRRREIDILVGTQMVTKGHDVPTVTLVGVVLADQSMAFPDFRAAERTFQLLAQVAGRSGRGEAAGRVVFQTFLPDHYAVRCAAAHDYDGFYRAELAQRRELGYAPFSRMVAIRLDAGDDRRVREAARELARVAHHHADVRAERVEVLGPAPAPLGKLRGRYRHRLLLRSAHRPALRRVATALVGRIDEGLGPARATLDVDPVSML
ncbi:MAG: replication restart helicase PriA [Myxococcota bacterium]